MSAAWFITAGAAAVLGALLVFAVIAALARRTRCPQCVCMRADAARRAARQRFGVDPLCWSCARASDRLLRALKREGRHG